jgi:2,3-dihydroxy-p-cumate/2,3-dihydroxybenzoate 3,4-dioxygenase
MLRYHHLSSVTLVVTDLERARAFYARLPGLEALPDEAAAAARFHVGDRSTILEIRAGSQPALRRFGFQMESAEALAALRAVLSNARVPWMDIDTGLRMVEPHTGAEVDFQLAATGESSSAGGAIDGFGHVVVRTPRYREAVAFWRDVLGFRLSDEIEDRISLLRCFPNPQHHSFGIANGERRMFHHLNFRIREGTDLDAIARNFTAAGVRIASGPGIHAPSGSRFLYFYDPDGLTLELATITERFVEGRERPPRVLPDRPESFAIDNVRRDPAMFTVGEMQAP